MIDGADDPLAVLFEDGIPPWLAVLGVLLIAAVSAYRIVIG